MQPASDPHCCESCEVPELNTDLTDPQIKSWSRTQNRGFGENCYSASNAISSTKSHNRHSNSYSSSVAVPCTS
uniref:Uncharacterized protein n=1 Tax=Anguilla anguilla TaxID=7936 RepID=A0A0E9W6I1_ANGAN